jgi:hypothetical protein
MGDEKNVHNISIGRHEILHLCINVGVEFRMYENVSQEDRVKEWGWDHKGIECKN